MNSKMPAIMPGRGHMNSALISASLRISCQFYVINLWTCQAKLTANS